MSAAGAVLLLLALQALYFSHYNTALQSFIVILHSSVILSVSEESVRSLSIRKTLHFVQSDRGLQSDRSLQSGQRVSE